MLAFTGKYGIDDLNPNISIIHAGIYWLAENATTCMVIFHIGIMVSSIVPQYSSLVLLLANTFVVFLGTVEFFLINATLLIYE